MSHRRRSTVAVARVATRTAVRHDVAPVSHSAIFRAFDQAISQLQAYEWALVLVLALGAFGYLVAWQRQGVVPHDTGALAQQAERILDGEMPHQDFDALYTGALSFMHAGACKVFGVHTRALRYPLMITTTIWIVAVYVIGRRVTGLLGATVIAVTALFWSVPNYPSPLPSWYNLFLATFGVWALLKFLESKRWQWLLLAGCFGGLSITVKVIGLYYVAAVGLWLIYRSQLLGKADKSAAPIPRYWRAGAWFLSVALGLFAVMLFRIASFNPAAMEWIHFALPGVVLAVWLSWREWELQGRGADSRYRQLGRELGVFAAGVLIPIALFLIPFVFSGGMDDLLYGVFVLPTKRLTHAEMICPLPPGIALLWLIPLMVVTFLPMWRPRWFSEPVVIAGIICVLGFGVLASGEEPWFYRGVWCLFRGLVPIVALAACLLLGQRRYAQDIDPVDRQRIVLMVAVAAMVNLVQIPIANGIYFLYAAPLVMLAAIYLVAHQPGGIQPVHWSGVVAAAVFALLWMHGAFPHDYDTKFTALPPMRLLQLDRCELEVDDLALSVYTQINQCVAEHSAPGSYIYAAPDCPEVYFFTGRKNPTRTMFDIFDDDFGTPERVERTLQLLRDRNVQLVVAKHRGDFSGPFNQQLADAIRTRYPHSYQVADPRYGGKPMFTVFWTASPPQSETVSQAGGLRGRQLVSARP